MIDTHCHLDMEQFDPDREAVIARARDAGFEALITIGSDLEGSRGAVGLAERHDMIYATVGIHPHDAKEFGEEASKQIRAWVRHPKVVAVGEIGLDYHYDLSPREVQREAFKRQLDFARNADMPVVIHCREAKLDTMRILEESGVKKSLLFV